MFGFCDNRGITKYSRNLTTIYEPMHILGNKMEYFPYNFTAEVYRGVLKGGSHSQSRRDVLMGNDKEVM